MDLFAAMYKKSNAENALPMAKYMKNQFPFLGLKKPERMKLVKPHLQEKKKEKRVDWDFIRRCYAMPEREFQYVAIDYLELMRDFLTAADMDRIEWLVRTKSWWDTVDALNRVVGYLVMKYPVLKEQRVRRWMTSDNIWLVRLSLIFQLKYKEKTDTEFLKEAILANCRRVEFFIDKAIGWILREYSKTNPSWVKSFLASYGDQLSSLSIREGSKYL